MPNERSMIVGLSPDDGRADERRIVWPRARIRGHASDNYLLWHVAWPRPVVARIAGGDPHALSDDDLAGMDRVLIRIDVDRVYGASYLWPTRAGRGRRERRTLDPASLARHPQQTPPCW
jgi:hypothetical protein